MARISLLVVFLFAALGAAAQVAPGRYWVTFTDKENTPYSVDNPSEFLSARAIERRVNQGIPVTQEDLPINPNYVDQVLALGQIALVQASKWFNGIVIEPDDPTILEQVEQLTFVADVRQSPVIGRAPFLERPSDARVTEARNLEIYGEALHQVEMLNGHLLHEAGYTGAGMRIGVMDGGYLAADLMEAFQHVYDDGRLIGTYDFVNNQQNVYNSSAHGTRVWSAMASYWPDSIVGSAYASEYMLFLTENVFSEYQLEEINWVAAAEIADSAGVDVLNTSLGYTLFNDSTQNYTYADMDGQTTYISRAGNIAARKGMLVVNSAGNSGSNDWYYIGAPADADSVLAVGAVRADSVVVAFSSRGPSADGRVKPNVCAQGFQTVLANIDSTVIRGNGTSFSSPVLAGLAACLWQTNPMATNMQVFRAIEESAHLFNAPNDSMGYGIPNFFAAQAILEALVASVADQADTPLQLSVAPNPALDQAWLRIVTQKGGTLDLQMTDLSGRVLLTEQQYIPAGVSVIPLQALARFAASTYILRARINDLERVVRIQINAR